jgi:MinD-like ATPase involved in chromosome partitioning or flagellar assembly
MNTSDEELTTKAEELEGETLTEEGLSEGDEDEGYYEEGAAEEAAIVHPWPITLFGGNTDRVPRQGWRSTLYNTAIWKYPGINIGPTDREIIEIEQARCRDYRARLWKTPGAVCVGVFSPRGGDGKTTLSGLFEQAGHDLNPVAEDAIVIDVNTSATTLDVVNGFNKEDFLTGTYWTMETLYAFIMEQGGDIDDVNLIKAKLAYREGYPQLPVIPLQLEPADFDESEDTKSQFPGAHYRVVLRVLKKFFSLIIHDFGTSTKDELTRAAFRELHILAILTHTGLATTKMVANTLETLSKNLPELLDNTVVIFNLSDRPSKEALRAIRVEKAGDRLLWPRLRKFFRRLHDPTKRKPKKQKADADAVVIQTPGQALKVINDLLALKKIITQELAPHEIAMVGYDTHLRPENKIYFSEVSDTVKGHLWTAWARMLEFRVEFEQGLIEQLPDELPDGVLVRRMDRMTLEIPADMQKDHEFLRNVPEGFVVVRRKPKEQLVPTANASTVANNPVQ